MYDGEWNTTLDDIFDEGAQTLKNWDETFNKKRDRILIKCGAGTSRSVSQYLNYICARDNITFMEAYGDYRNSEDKWAEAYANRDYWPGMPSPAFLYYLSEKYPRTHSEFGEIENAE
jgi:hypothetical protein